MQDCLHKSSTEIPQESAALQAEGADLPFLEAPGLAWLQDSEVLARRIRLGMAPGTSEAAFASSCEFISLGSTCQVARALQALGLKGLTYPFDWLQSPLSGIIHLFETGFEDFLTYTMLKDTSHTTGEDFGHFRARWGGSFWHHDLESPKVRTDFERRIRRLLGVETRIHPSMPRVFVRAVASTMELDLTLRLHETLRQALPSSRIYMLLIVELQDGEEVVTLSVRSGADVCIYRVHGHLYADDGKNWTKEAHTDSLATAMACAISMWSECGWAAQSATCVASLEQVCARCDEYDAGDPGSEHFWPRRFRGQRLANDRPEHIPRLFPIQFADVQIPDDSEWDDVLRLQQAFGICGICIKIPAGAMAGQIIRLQHAGGALTAVLRSEVEKDVLVWVSRASQK